MSAPLALNAPDEGTGQRPRSHVVAQLESPLEARCARTAQCPGVTFLSCTHTGLPATATAEHLEIGWVSNLSGLKTLVETGQPMSTPPPA